MTRHAPPRAGAPRARFDRGLLLASGASAPGGLPLLLLWLLACSDATDGAVHANGDLARRQDEMAQDIADLRVRVEGLETKRRRRHSTTQHAEFRADPAAVRTVAQSDAAFRSAARLLPHAALDGSTSGVRITGIQGSHLFDDLQLHNGDIVTRIGDATLDGEDPVGHLQAAFAQWQDDQPLDLDVRRARVDRVHTYAVNASVIERRTYRVEDAAPFAHLGRHPAGPTLEASEEPEGVLRGLRVSGMSPTFNRLGWQDDDVLTRVQGIRIGDEGSRAAAEKALTRWDGSAPLEVELLRGHLPIAITYAVGPGDDEEDDPRRGHGALELTPSPE